MKNESKHLSHSILLEETGSPIIIRLVVLSSVIILSLFIAWSMTTRLTEVAIAEGEIIPTGSVQKIQHLKGGTIAEIFLQEGQIIKKGDLLIQLETGVIISQLEEVLSHQEALNASKLRLSAQVQGVIPDFDEKGEKNKAFKQDQKRIFEYLQSYQITRRAITSEHGEMQQAGLEILAEQKKTLLDLAKVNEELAQVQAIIKRHREHLRLMTITAPISGFVHGLKFQTKGTVISPGETIMEIVPREHNLVAEIQISTTDIGHIKVGQKVILKFNTYDFSRYGGMEANLVEISATTFFNRTGFPYYKGIVKIPKNYLGSNENENIIFPGMTLQADISTGSKTIMEYLLKPVFASARDALRER